MITIPKSLTKKENLYKIAIGVLGIGLLLVVVIFLNAQGRLSTYDGLGYTISYPSNWKAAELDTEKKSLELLVTDLKSTSVYVEIGTTSDLTQEIDVGVLANAYLDQLELDPEISVAYIEDLEVAGLRANKIIYEKAYEGQKRISVEIFIVKRDLVYKFNLSTVQDEYSKASPLFENVLKSLTII